MAKIHFKYGAMNSGKSDTLIKTAYNYRENSLDVIIIKPSIDTKGGEFITARSGSKMKIDIFATPGLNLQKAVLDYAKNNKLTNISCILIDEAQFLEPNQVDDIYKIAKINDISVITYGLRADFRTELFPGSKRLFEIVDNIEKLPTMCRCGSQAEFNCRMNNGEFVFEGDQIAIDGDMTISYRSLCGACYEKEKNLIQPKPQHFNNKTRRIISKEEKGI